MTACSRVTWPQVRRRTRRRTEQVRLLFVSAKVLLVLAAGVYGCVALFLMVASFLTGDPLYFGIGLALLAIPILLNSALEKRRLPRSSSGVRRTIYGEPPMTLSGKIIVAVWLTVIVALIAYGAAH
jgi:hypothetical protein